MASTLSVDRVVRVSVNLQPKAAQRRNFGVLCIAGSSDVIMPNERIRYYTGIDGVANDFGVDAPEYKAAELFFSQTPRPYILGIGRWIKADTPAYLIGGTVTQTAVSDWSGIADGAFGLVVNGTGITVDGLDFSGTTNMNGVAGVIAAALAADGATCTWEGDHFRVATIGTGAEQALGFAVAPGAGTDISAKLAVTEALALPLVAGMDAETPLECALELADHSGGWYGLTFADALTTAEHLAVSGYVEAASKSRMYAATVTDSRILSSTVTDDLASQLKALGRNRTFVQYSANQYAACSALGRAFTVNFNANRSTITLKFKQEPGVVAEGLTETQATTLTSKNCNVFAAYDNDTAILQEGVMSGGAFFDEIHGLDWLQNAVQTECYNALYQSKTKIPQTDAGVNRIVATISKVMKEGVNNGLIAPGMWNADGFGQLETGDYLPTGFYIYAQPVDDQPQSEREQRKAPPIQVAAKLAGAIHSVDVQIDVNR
ncbi:DUF3383 domain-containing protein [Desulfovibrio psychrotolerans]|uniref:DUF3383 domain-containing protein n=1 Tax=Desulfovibrio psychrotolerans TaxID=415242 RepID=A0A7J0BWB3_9BACT|nr:DUF3383 domain-containing protein [Desulfovibrio psychrotolerans]GFM38000.1 hypothetical protein DSM19430T_26840 [Desulfovibrio psychrotolerans]